MPDVSRKGTSRRPSLTDVAIAAGVSPAAVSKVIRGAYGVSPAMKERVQAAIDSLGYRPSVAARVMRGSSFTLGFEIPHLGNDLHLEVVQGAAKALMDGQYQLMISSGLGFRSADSVFETLIDHRVDGIVAISSEVGSDWLERLAQRVPLVLLAPHDGADGYDTVIGDDVDGVNQVMDHLLGLGHRRITHLTIPRGDDDSSLAVRIATYRKRMADAGLEPHVVYVQASDEGAYQSTRAVLARGEPPTAIFAGYDTLAIGVLRAVADLGLTAEQISVAGYDDIHIARHPLVSLTSVDQFGGRIGAAATELLLDRIQTGRTTPRHVRFKPELRVRKSTRPCLDAG